MIRMTRLGRKKGLSTADPVEASRSVVGGQTPERKWLFLLGRGLMLLITEYLVPR
jgi:hypothetical protein